jgi:hypothetical protein
VPIHVLVSQTTKGQRTTVPPFTGSHFPLKNHTVHVADIGFMFSSKWRRRSRSQCNHSVAEEMLRVKPSRHSMKRHIARNTWLPDGLSDTSLSSVPSNRPRTRASNRSNCRDPNMTRAMSTFCVGGDSKGHGSMQTTPTLVHTQLVFPKMTSNIDFAAEYASAFPNSPSIVVGGLWQSPLPNAVT